MRCESPFDSLVAIHTAGILGRPMQMNVFLKGGFMEIIAWISVEEKTVMSMPRRSKNVVMSTPDRRM
jgi:hypothetical protein